MRIAFVVTNHRRQFISVAAQLLCHCIMNASQQAHIVESMLSQQYVPDGLICDFREI